jgi:K+-transporting ATPase KdpF subunit
VIAIALDTLLALAVSLGLAAYLFYVLARPERF